MKIIDINDWKLSGGGGAGVSYTSKTDPDLILKMDNREVAQKEVEQSLATARLVYALGIPTPVPREVVFDGKRYGQVFNRIHDKISYARLIGRHPDQIPQIARDFATMVKKLHSTKVKGSGLRSIKEIYGDLINANFFRPQEMKDRALKLLSSLPEGDTCIHGDLHYGNVIRAGGTDYFIDIANFGYGHPYFDIAMMAAIHQLSYFCPDLHIELFHHSPAQGDIFWNCFVKEYFGEDVSTADAEKAVMPFLAVRMMTMETEIGKPLPQIAIEQAILYLAQYSTEN